MQRRLVAVVVNRLNVTVVGALLSAQHAEAVVAGAADVEDANPGQS